MVFPVLNHQVEGQIRRTLFRDIQTRHKIQISVSINKVLLEQKVPIQFCSFVDYYRFWLLSHYNCRVEELQ